MDREKMLKKYITKFIIGNTVSASVFFIWIYLWATDVISNKIWIVSGIVMIVMSLTAGHFYNKKYGRRDKARLLRIMPLIISIHDTPDKLKKTKSVLTVLDVLSFGFGCGLAKYIPVFSVLCPISFIFRQFSNITNEKIKYLESKPEGL